MKERRKHRRAAIYKRVWLCDFDENTSPVNPRECLIVDISEGGACIRCSARYKEGQPVAFTYQDFMEEGLRPVIGVVMWSRQHSETDYQYGIQFLGLGTQMLRRIQDMVTQTAGGTREPLAQRGNRKRTED